jgi:hypothetical protein
LMFMTSLFIKGIADNYLTIPNPVDLIINAEVIKNVSYFINASLSTKCYIEKLHFSMIIRYVSNLALLAFSSLCSAHCLYNI